MSRLAYVATTSQVMYDMMKGDVLGNDTQAFIKSIVSHMTEKAHRLSRVMTDELMDDEIALTAHADSMRSIAKFIEQLPKDIERAKNEVGFMSIALDKSCYLYAQFQAMELRLR